jgi:hypothetical protein
MVSSVLPIYLLVHLQLSPLQFGVVDGSIVAVANSSSAGEVSLNLRKLL